MRHSNTTSVLLLFVFEDCLLCATDSHIKKMNEREVIDNQPKHLCHYRLGPAILLCMTNYISVYKLQEEAYLYRWRRGRETGEKLLGVSSLVHPHVL